VDGLKSSRTKVTLEKSSRNQNKMTRMMTFLFPAIAVFTTLALSGCVTKSKANAEARAAYVAGQKDAYAAIAATQRSGIKVIGPVQHADVPWVGRPDSRTGDCHGYLHRPG